MRVRNKRGYHGSPSTKSLAKSLHKKLMRTLGKKCFTIVEKDGGVSVVAHNSRNLTDISAIVNSSCNHKYDFEAKVFTNTLDA